MDAVREISDYLQLCARELEGFWGFPLPRLPEVKLAETTQEDFANWELQVNPDEALESSKRIAALSYQPFEACLTGFYGHATNHFFAHTLNKRMTDCSFPHIPDEDPEHVATVEAVVSAATLWLLEKKNCYRGNEVVKAYFTYWEDTLEEKGLSPEPARLSRGAYYTLKKMGIPAFKKFVEGYTSDRTTFGQKKA